MAEQEKSVTSKDVARLAGVSQSTVSRVFMESSSSSAETREKVLNAAKVLNYRPNAFARSLTTNESKLIGLVFPDRDYPVHMETLQLISSELQKNGYSAVLIPWQINDKEQHSIPNIFRYRVDGVVAASAQFNTALFEECEKFNIPIVQFARVEKGSSSSCAIADNYGAGQKAAELFVQRGAMNPAYLSGHIPSYTNAEREQGFVEGIEQLTGKKPLVVNANYNYDEAIKGIAAMLKSPHRPDAVFCSTDILAVALMDVARFDFGLSIPEDVQIIGFDDIPEAGWKSYQLTTFRQNFQRLAKESVRILLHQIKSNEHRLTRIMLPAQLIERRTLKIVNQIHF